MPTPDAETLRGPTTLSEAPSVGQKDASLEHLALAKTIPFLKYRYVDVTFTVVGQDVAIPHDLRSSMPEAVRFEVVRQSAPGVVYQDLSATRKPWQTSHIHLRASQPMVARLRLSIESPLEASSMPQRASGTLWTPIAHASGNFTADSGSWTVDSADQITFAYTYLHPGAVLVQVAVETTSVSATPTLLYIALPFTARYRTSGSVAGTDNGTRTALHLTIEAGAAFLSVRRADGATWATATNTTAVNGQIILAL